MRGLHACTGHVLCTHNHATASVFHCSLLPCAKEAGQPFVDRKLGVALYIPLPLQIVQLFLAPQITLAHVALNSPGM